MTAPNGAEIPEEHPPDPSFVVFAMASGVGSIVPAAFPLLSMDFLQAHRIAFVVIGLLGLSTPLAVLRWAIDVKPDIIRHGILPRKSLRILAKFSTPNFRAEEKCTNCCG